MELITDKIIYSKRIEQLKKWNYRLHLQLCNVRLKFKQILNSYSIQQCISLNVFESYIKDLEKATLKLDNEIKRIELETLN